MTAYQVLNSPLVTAAISSALGLLTALAIGVFRLGMLVARMEASHREMAENIRAIRDDKDVIRWSDTAP